MRVCVRDHCFLRQLVVYNPNEKLSLTQQRQRLPIYKNRAATTEH